MNQLDKDIQAVLKGRGYFLGNTGPNRDGVDGQLGDISKRAILSELAKVPGNIVVPAGPRGLTDPAAFFNRLRRDLFPGSMTVPQVEGINFKLDAMANAAWPVSWVAYGLVTSYHETGSRMQPVREGFATTDAQARRICASRAYGKPGRNGGQVAYGRGDVQLTWDDNYERADRELNLGGALVANYDKALQADISARIMVEGMTEGWFAKDSTKNPYTLGRMLPDPVASLSQFIPSRRIINGMDKAELIAGYAVKAQQAVLEGGWR